MTAKYIGMDVHQATISVAVRDSRGNLVMEAILETKAETILHFIGGLRGSLYVAFEEGTWAAWLHDLLQPLVARVLACDPRKNALLKAGNKSDRIDARKLSELLYLKRRAELYYQQFDALAALRQGTRRELLAEARKHPAMRLLRQIPAIGPIRAALLIALVQTPNRFRTKRQLWAYCGLALRTHTSGDYRFVGGQLKRSKKVLAVRGHNINHHHDLKNIFKGAATRAASTAGPFQDFYQACVARGVKPHLARLTLARKIASITLLVWKKGARFDAEHLKQQAA
jgi:transposase